MKKIAFIFYLFVFQHVAIAQIHEIGVFGGGSNFIGDVGSTTYINPNKWAYGFLYKWNKSPRHSWRFSYVETTLRNNDILSNDPSRKMRGYIMQNKINELSVGLEFNFLDFDLHQPDWQFTPYIYSGLSMFFLERDDKQKSFNIPMVVGAKTRLTEHLNIGFEIGARYTFTDNIDGSKPNNPKYVQYAFGNLNSNDWYVFSGFTLTYTFGQNPCFCNY